MVPRGQVWRSLMLKGKPVFLSYGGMETRRIAQEHGTQVLMQPDICYMMREQELGLLHVGLSWTIGAAWPFLAKSTRAAALIVPFDFGDDLKYPDLVMIVPLGYLPNNVLQEFQWLLDTHHASGLRCMYEFPNSTHFYIRSMILNCMLAMMSFTLARNMPMVITLTAE